jgi:hypothetical protein
MRKTPLHSTKPAPLESDDYSSSPATKSGSVVGMDSSRLEILGEPWLLACDINQGSESLLPLPWVARTSHASPAPGYSHASPAPGYSPDEAAHWDYVSFP